VNGPVEVFDVIDAAYGVEDADVVLFDGLPLERVDVANSDVRQVLEAQSA